MQYKGYTITAEVETYEEWDIDQEGELKSKVDDGDFEIVGYKFKNLVTGDHYIESMSECSVDELRQSVDMHLAEIAG